MNRPNRYLLRMVLFLGAVIAVGVVLFPGLRAAFEANAALNGLILGVFLIGTLLIFRQVLMLKPETQWLESWRRGSPLSGSQLRLLGPMAAMIGERQGRMNLSAMALRSLLDSIATRLDEGRELAKYFVGLLIFLGLLGTFWGLSRTVGSIGDVIASLNVTGADAGLAFEHLKHGLEQPLSGMGTAFSTSLFGLAGSLVLGFLDLQAGQAQNAFYNDLEDWLAGQTRLGSNSGVLEGVGEQAVPAYIQALLEQTADSLDELTRIMARGEESRIAANTQMRAMTEKLGSLSDHMRAEQNLLIKLGESQLEMRPLLQKLSQGSQGIDESTKAHIRNADLLLQRLVEDNQRSHEELIGQLRNEFRLLARTIASEQ